MYWSSDYNIRNSTDTRIAKVLGEISDHSTIKVRLDQKEMVQQTLNNRDGIDPKTIRIILPRQTP